MFNNFIVRCFHSVCHDVCNKIPQTLYKYEKIKEKKNCCVNGIMWFKPWKSRSSLHFHTKSLSCCFIVYCWHKTDSANSLLSVCLHNTLPRPTQSGVGLLYVASYMEQVKKKAEFVSTGYSTLKTQSPSQRSPGSIVFLFSPTLPHPHFSTSLLLWKHLCSTTQVFAKTSMLQVAI